MTYDDIKSHHITSQQVKSQQTNILKVVKELKNIYEAEQIAEFARKIDLFIPMQEILNLLDTSAEMNMKDIGNSVGISTYSRDKAILALEFPGFIAKKEIAGAKIYFITEQGKKLIEEIGRIKG